MSRVNSEVHEALADVLVIGGGPAGAWAALMAARAGSQVILADKGYLGTSGATAPSNTGTWCVPPEQRATEIARRRKLTGDLAVPEVMQRTLAGSWDGLQQLLEWGYPFPQDDEGDPYLANLRGPDYMRFMRQKVREAGVTIMDHSPALALLKDASGVAGAVGLNRQKNFFWRIAASSVVLATGGCAFGERILGATGLTGDGYLMGMQAGAALSGMEYSAQYGITPVHTSMNKGVIYQWATFYDAHGAALVIDGDRQTAVARALLAGPVFACLDRANAALQACLRQSQPNCFVPFDRQGINPFSDKFEVVLRCEGTVRGLGGLRLQNYEGATDVPGLYAAGDAASRESMNGVISGGGGPNASWAIATGRSAGVAAANVAKKLQGLAVSRQQKHRQTPLLNIAGLGYDLHGGSVHGEVQQPDAIIDAVRQEMLPLDKNFFRTNAGIRQSLSRLNGLSKSLGLYGYSASDSMVELLRRREARSLLAVSRWSYKAALLRQESRGIHRLMDQPHSQPEFSQQIVINGLNAPAWERRALLECD